MTDEELKNMSETQLADAIEYHNRQYWEKAEPEITDEEYDELLKSLRDINPDHPLVNKVNAPEVAGSGKVEHEKPMLSLDKAYSVEELMTWARKFIRSEDEEFLVQPKYDGISARYSSQILATRGDGFRGENISDKLPLIELEAKDYKGKIPENCNVRGEIVIRNDDFKNIYSGIRKKGGGSYKNSRNAVAGIMGLKDINDMLGQGAKLTLVSYDKICYRVKFHEFEKKWPEILREIEELPYPMDGIVVKFADEEYSESLGTTAHHPRGQIAFKFSGVRKTTKLLNVNWSFGKNCITPVAELEPVEIGGITIKHATLHNLQNIIDKNIKINDIVVVERAGDVIPYIVSAREGENRKDCIISNCPCCGEELRREGPELCCKNPDCFETKLQKLLAAVRNIGIERLGEPNIRKMMNKLGVKSLKDIFTLSFDDIMSLEGFKEKSANNLLGEINKARTVNDFQIMAALNIPGIGKTVAQKILTEYTINELRGLNRDQLSEIDGIGPERAEALQRELEKQSSLLDELLECVDVKQSKGKSIGKTICFTGKMPEKRSFYEKLARERGFEPKSSVTQDLNVLVCADPEGSSSKLKDARNYGVEIVALDKWLNHADQPPPEQEDEGADNITAGLDLFDHAREN